MAALWSGADAADAHRIKPATAAIVAVDAGFSRQAATSLLPGRRGPTETRIPDHVL